MKTHAENRAKRAESFFASLAGGEPFARNTARKIVVRKQEGSFGERHMTV